MYVSGMIAVETGSPLRVCIKTSHNWSKASYTSYILVTGMSSQDSLVLSTMHLDRKLSARVK